MTTLLLAVKPDHVETEIAEIRTLMPSARLLVTEDHAQMEAALDDVEIAAGHIPLPMILRAPRLRWYQQWGAGADWLLRHPEAAERPFMLTNASGVHAIPISEHIMSFLLAFARGLPQSIRAQERGAWLKGEQRLSIFELAGSTLLVIGVGAIGERTALLAGAFGMRVLGIRRDPSQTASGVAYMGGPSELPELLPQADVVVITLPLTGATRKMIGAPELALMKPSAYIINIGRGGTIDEAALVQALRAGQIAGAGLDVFETEPLPAASPLWGLPNVIITAHYSGSTPHYEERAMAIFLDNLRRYVAGRPLRNVVDKAAGY